MLANVRFVDPSFDREMTGGKVIEAIVTSRVRLLKIRRFQNQDRSAHAIMNLAMHRDDAGFIENNRAWLFIFSIPTEIESFRFRIRKNVVVSVVEVWKFDRAADVDSNQVRREQ